MSTLPTTTTTLSTVKHLATTNATITATTTTANTTVSPSSGIFSVGFPIVDFVQELAQYFNYKNASCYNYNNGNHLHVSRVDVAQHSHKYRRSDLIGGTARWRLAASQQSGAGPQQTAANYAPMGGARSATATNGLDTPGPDRLDWERQFFDDTEATINVHV
ncbi:unnamed protein product [Nippostrongylus brasiliensis]|uniref:Uncharacterized protein n=1 Tax=Nippostrongylus brasiliensis TaxID=27835 RepID=A0A0N4XFJ6_NIPBR|nr:unnamed protein product [Nippostrongylus brasiliensis]